MQELISLLKSNGVYEAYLFGSRARGEATDQSDWDLGVRFSEPLGGLEAHSRLAILEIKLKALLGKPVDIVDLRDAQITLLYEVVWKGQCLFTDSEERRIENELAVRRQFEDYQAIQSFYTRALKERLSNAS